MRKFLLSSLMVFMVLILLLVTPSASKPITMEVAELVILNNQERIRKKKFPYITVASGNTYRIHRSKLSYTRYKLPFIHTPKILMATCKAESVQGTRAKEMFQDLLEASFKIKVHCLLDEGKPLIDPMGKYFCHLKLDTRYMGEMLMLAKLASTSPHRDWCGKR